MSTQFTQEVQMVNQNMKKHLTLPEMREMQSAMRYQHMLIKLIKMQCQNPVLVELGNRPESIDALRVGTLEPSCYNTNPSMGHF